jgi:glyoxylase-like metal-dependent hydrolase (beta-lactamase superfamily II)
LNNMPPSLEIGPVRIYQGQKNGKYPDGNQVVVQGGDRRAVFDSPLVASRIGEDFLGADLVIQGHIHEDHATGLYLLPHIPVHVHHRDLPALQSWEGLAAAYGYAEHVFPSMRESIARDFNFTPRADAVGYDDDAVWDLGGGITVRAIHAPGHTAGHCILLVEPASVAFIGDIDLSGFGPYYGDQTSNLTEFRRTLAQLPDIPANTWITYHHRGIYTDRALFLQDLAEFTAKIDGREQRLLGYLQQGSKNIEQLADLGLMYKPDTEGVWVRDAEKRAIGMHLEELLGDGRIALDDGGRYRISG